MIGMTVRDEYRSNSFTFEGGSECVSVAVEARTWVDHDYVTFTDDVCTGASIGEFRGVFSNYSTNI